MSPKKEEAKKQLMLSLEKGVHRRLKAVARFEGRHMTWLAAQLIDEYTRRAIEKNPHIIEGDEGDDGKAA